MKHDWNVKTMFDPNFLPHIPHSHSHPPQPWHCLIIWPYKLTISLIHKLFICVDGHIPTGPTDGWRLSSRSIKCNHSWTLLVRHHMEYCGAVLHSLLWVQEAHEMRVSQLQEEDWTEIHYSGSKRSYLLKHLCSFIVCHRRWKSQQKEYWMEVVLAHCPVIFHTVSISGSRGSTIPIMRALVGGELRLVQQ